MQSRWCRGNWQGQTWPTLCTSSAKRLFAVCLCPLVGSSGEIWRPSVNPPRTFLENWNSSTTAPAALFSPWWASTAPASSDRLCCSSDVLPRRCCFECLHSPRVPTLGKSPFSPHEGFWCRRNTACLRPGFPILVSRQWRRQIEASIDRGQSSRTHASGHAIESPSRLRWQPRIIVRYFRGLQPRRKTKWRRPRYTLSSMVLFTNPWRFLNFHFCPKLKLKSPRNSE